MSAHLSRKSNRPTQHGFSMIEVLVTMAVVAVGLMGLIALMMKGLQANSGSAIRSVAVAQAYDMADRMRANLAGVQAGNYDNTVPPGSTSACSISGNVAPPDPDALGSCSTCSSSCTVANISTMDQCLWHLANAKLLPSGSGAVCKETGDNRYSIFVSWDDSKSGSPSKTFILRFEP